MEASNSNIVGVNVAGVLCCLAVVVFGRLRRSSRAESPPLYTPGPYKPIGDEATGRGAGSELKGLGSALKPFAVKAKAASNAKATTKRR